MEFVSGGGRGEIGREWFREQAEGFSGELRFDEPLSKHTYYRIGGPASVVAIPRSIEDLQWIARGIRATQIPFFLLGAGSNLLVSDAGFSGLVIKCTRINLDIFPVDDGGAVRTGVSVAVSSLLRKAAQMGWAGLEFLTGVPGNIGGVVSMNAGTHLGEAKDRLVAVEAFPLVGAEGGEHYDPIRYESGAFRFEYRRNLFLPAGSVVCAAEWRVDQDDPARVKAVLDEMLARRKATQPIDYPSCGSVFKNPREQGVSAWQVVDRLGLRGHRIGGAQFAEKHSNFIINLGGAKASDVAALIALAKSRAKAELGIMLEEEVKYLGTFVGAPVPQGV